MKMLLWQMFVGTRGGYNRGIILKHLIDKPHNTNQLAKALNMDYETARHHLDVLAKNGIITTEGEKFGKTYFLSKAMKVNLDEFNQIWEEMNP
jgi:DNA-binding transcriptional ArsR family regulator